MAAVENSTRKREPNQRVNIRTGESLERGREGKSEQLDSFINNVKNWKELTWLQESSDVWVDEGHQIVYMKLHRHYLQFGEISEGVVE